MKATTTHEEFIAQVRSIAIHEALESRRTIDSDEAARLDHTKLVYGVGDGSYRGVCHYEAWQNGVGTVDVIEVAAMAEESFVQLAGTTIHELGHVLAGHGTGHGPEWKVAVERLGLRRPMAAGQRYMLAQMDPIVRERVAETAKALADGNPAFRSAYGLGLLGLLMKVQPRPCTAGHGTKGGRSRGAGSGSRMRKVVCSECGYTARTTAKWLAVGPPICPVENHGSMREEEAS